MLHVSLHIRREKPLFSTPSLDMQILSGRQGVAGGEKKIMNLKLVNLFK